MNKKPKSLNLPLFHDAGPILLCRDSLIMSYTGLVRNVTLGARIWGAPMERHLLMSLKELRRKGICEEVVAGRLTLREGSRQLVLSYRQMLRL